MIKRNVVLEWDELRKNKTREFNRDKRVFVLLSECCLSVVILFPFFISERSCPSPFMLTCWCLVFSLHLSFNCFLSLPLSICLYLSLSLYISIFWSTMCLCLFLCLSKTFSFCWRFKSVVCFEFRGGSFLFGVVEVWNLNCSVWSC